MPLCTLHLISLDPSTSIPSFLSLLSSHSPAIKPLLASRVIRWIITPTTLTAGELLHPSTPWDLLIILPDTTALPEPISSHIRNIYTLTAGIPSRITSSFASSNPALLHPDPSTVPPLQQTSSLTSTPSVSSLPSTSQNLELSPSLLTWMKDFSVSQPGRSPVSMLNLLAFHSTDSAKANYQKYGAAFAKSIGSRHGGNAKIVGTVISSSTEGVNNYSNAGWAEIAVAQYPSIAHFAAMLGSPDYQEVNHKYRVPSLKDTCILCTSEIAVEEEIKEWQAKGGRGGKDVGVSIGERASGGAKL